MGERGISLILVTALLFVLFIFFSLAVDTAYIFYVRGQLQNAADAGALGGVSLLDVSLDPDAQTVAKAEAEKFAEENFAGGEHVLMQYTPSSNVESLTNDITVGFWNVLDDTYTAGGTPLNAIKVVARRTEGESGRGEGQFGLFFGRFLDLDFFPVSAVAIAQKPAIAEVPFAICLDTCVTTFAPWDPIPRTGGLTLYFKPTAAEQPDEKIVAWTTLAVPQSSSSPPQVIDFICDLNSVDACGEDVATTHGLMSSVLRQLRCAFLDPTYDTENKTIVAGSVVGWTVIVPVLETCPPSRQGRDNDPRKVIDWGRVKIVEVYTATAPVSCGGCCRTCPDYAPLPVDFEDGEQITGAIRISELECQECSTATFFARRNRLVK